MARRTKSKNSEPAEPTPDSEPSDSSPGTSRTISTNGPQFGEPTPTPDPTKFSVKHGSDSQAYKILDSQKGTLQPRPFPIESAAEPRLTLADALGKKGSDIESAITRAGQIVFHSVGDTGNTKGPNDMELVADKMVSDYNETDPRAVPSFLYHLGDVVYSFGEAEYYYDQFYDPFRNYPAPIFAVPGNHDGMVAPNTAAESLAAFFGELLCKWATATSDAGIEYHPSSDGETAKTPDDSVTVDLATRKIASYNVPDSTKPSSL